MQFEKENDSCEACFSCPCMFRNKNCTFRRPRWKELARPGADCKMHRAVKRDIIKKDISESAVTRNIIKEEMPINVAAVYETFYRDFSGQTLMAEFDFTIPVQILSFGV